MQKHHLFFLFLIATVLSYSSFAEAALQFLPRYQGGYGVRTQDGGRDKVTITCSSRGGYAKGANQTCTGMFMVSGLTCYKNCSCNNGYKANASSSGCVAKTCSDYSLKSSPDATMSCTSVSKAPNLTCYECVACDSSTYKYSCSGGLNASTQGTTNKCGTNYSECSCIEHASWNSSSGKCECGSDYKAGTTSCTLKTCEDYGYSATEDTTKDCTKQTPRSGLTCWSCSACTGTLYDCGSITNASGADTSSTSCGGKYAKCKCKDLYAWDNGICKLNCTRNSCSTTTYPLTAQNVANASSYEKCTPSCSDESPRYKVSACASGYSVNSSGSACVDDCAKYSKENMYAEYISNNAYYIDCMREFGSYTTYEGALIACGNSKYVKCKCARGDFDPETQTCPDGYGCSQYSIANKYVPYTSNNAYYVDCMNKFGSFASYDTTVDCGGTKYIHCTCRSGTAWNSAGTACENKTCTCSGVSNCSCGTECKKFYTNCTSYVTNIMKANCTAYQDSTSCNAEINQLLNYCNTYKSGRKSCSSGVCGYYKINTSMKFKSLSAVTAVGVSSGNPYAMYRATCNCTSGAYTVEVSQDTTSIQKDINKAKKYLTWSCYQTCFGRAETIVSSSSSCIAN